MTSLLYPSSAHTLDLDGIDTVASSWATGVLQDDPFTLSIPSSRKVSGSPSTWEEATTEDSDTAFEAALDDGDFWNSFLISNPIDTIPVLPKTDYLKSPKTDYSKSPKVHDNFWMPLNTINSQTVVQGAKNVQTPLSSTPVKGLKAFKLTCDHKNCSHEQQNICPRTHQNVSQTQTPSVKAEPTKTKTLGVKRRRDRVTNACESCHKSKVRCEQPEDGGPCKRCVRLNRECIEHKPRRQKKRTVSKSITEFSFPVIHAIKKKGDTRSKLLSCTSNLQLSSKYGVDESFVTKKSTLESLTKIFHPDDRATQVELLQSLIDGKQTSFQSFARLMHRSNQPINVIHSTSATQTPEAVTLTMSIIPLLSF
jgi:hypothetical protein